MEARVIFSKETKEKMEKGLTRKERNELRLKRLKELDASGELIKATSRLEVSRLMGFNERKYGAGYSWISKLVRDGYLKETLLLTSQSGRPEFEYRIARGARPKSSDRTTRRTSTRPRQRIDTSKIQKVVIRYGELSIELEQVDQAFISQVVSSLIDKKGA